MLRGFLSVYHNTGEGFLQITRRDFNDGKIETKDVSHYRSWLVGQDPTMIWRRPLSRPYRKIFLMQNWTHAYYIICDDDDEETYLIEIDLDTLEIKQLEMDGTYVRSFCSLTSPVIITTADNTEKAYLIDIKTLTSAKLKPDHNETVVVKNDGRWVPYFLGQIKKSKIPIELDGVTPLIEVKTNRFKFSLVKDKKSDSCKVTITETGTIFNTITRTGINSIMLADKMYYRDGHQVHAVSYDNPRETEIALPMTLGHSVVMLPLNPTQLLDRLMRLLPSALIPIVTEYMLEPSLFANTAEI